MLKQLRHIIQNSLREMLDKPEIWDSLVINRPKP